MIVKSIQLKDYRCFPELTMKFDDGVHTLVGKNGKGKSTILESVVWSLYGSKSGIVRTEKKGVIRTGCKKATAVLNFVEGEEEFKIERTITSYGKASADIYNSEGENLATGTDAVEKEVESIIGMNYQGFMSSTYSQQGMLGFFAQMRPAERKALVSKMLRIEDAEKKGDTAASMRKGLKKMLEDGMLAWYGRQYDSKIKEYDDTEKTLKESIERTGKIIEAGKKKISDVADDLKSRREGIEEMRKLAEEKSSLEGQLSRLDKDIVTCRDVLSKVRNSVKDFNNDNAELKGISIRDLQRDRKRIEDSIVSVSEKRGEYNSTITRAKQKIGKIISLGEGECPECGQDISGEHLESHKSDLKERKEEAEKKLADIDDEVKKLRAEVSELSSKEKLLREFDSLDEKLKSNTARLSELQNERGRIFGELRGVNYDDEDYGIKKKRVSEIEDKLSDMKDTMRDLEIDLNKNKKDLETLDKDRATFVAEKGRYDKTQNKVANLTLYVTAVDDFRKHIIEHIIPEVFEKASLVLRIISDGKFDSIVLAKNFDIAVSYDGEDFPLDKHSGGEKDLVNISLRIALCLLFGQSDLIMLDEVFGKLDEDVIDNVIDGFERLPFRQMFLVTHVDSIKGRLGELHDLDVSA